MYLLTVTVYMDLFRRQRQEMFYWSKVSHDGQEQVRMSEQLFVIYLLTSVELMINC